MHLSLAPLQGTTEYPFRNVWVQYFTGLDSSYTPFMPLATGTKIKESHLRDALPSLNQKVLPVIPQVIGKRPEAMVLMGLALAEMGYAEMNWNLGCPSGIVVKKQHGCGMMPHPDMIRAFLDLVIPSLPIGLSVKIRAGLNHPNELIPAIEAFNDYPLKKIILHPRLGIDHYSGKPNPDWFETALQHTVHPLVYNGDINNHHDLCVLQKRFQYQHEWMIGRGVLRNPYLPSLLKGGRLPDTEHRKNTLYHFSSELSNTLAQCGITEQRLLSKLKEYWSYFSSWFIADESLWLSLSRSQSMPEFNKTVIAAFSAIDLK